MTDTNVINFPRIGFNLTPTQTPVTLPDSPVVPPPATPDTTGDRARLSPLDAVAALADPGLTQPVVHVPALPTPGYVPTTFLNDPGNTGDAIGPRLGALSLAAILAVAVAAVRGIHTAAGTIRDRRQARQQERAEQTTSSLASGGKGGKRGRVQAGHEYGRSLLNRTGGGTRRSGGGGGRSGSTGSGAGPKSRSGATGPSRSGRSGGGRGGSLSSRAHRPGTPNRARKHTAGGGSSAGGSRKAPNRGAGPKTRHGAKHPKAPHRASQGGGTSLTKKQQKQHGGGKGRTTLPQALTRDTHKAAARRLERRRKANLGKPALWTSTNPKTKKQTPKTNRKGATTKPTAPNTTKTPDQEMWRNLKQAAARRWKKRTKRTQPPIWGTTKPNPGTGPAGKPKNAGAGTGPKTNTRKRKPTGGHGPTWWTKARDYARKNAGPTTGPGTSTGTGPKQDPSDGGDAWNFGQRTRRSPFQTVGSLADTQPVYEWPGHEPRTQRSTRPGLGNTVHGLPAAPAPHTSRPGTSRPIPMPPTGGTDRIQEARSMAAHLAHNLAGASMDAQHATEITLDDALDEYGDFKDDAFKTHDQTAKLATRARTLRDTLADFAQDLATNHNLIGPLFTGAMARMAESMDLIARMSDEMQVSSLEAAEMSESADNDLNDAYRPISQATADAGLTTPSAPIHNKN
ncbi:hypothetical protein [Streptomyces sp. NPDC093269]|uniref:hypothetical protein n=1 Tax=Streptomyces sp. NPDC093269 TaxID=3366038 RepID=UPI00380AD077